MGQPFTTVQFQGQLPALDPKQVAEPYVIEGKNFIVDAEGPISAFGQTIINYTRIEENILTYSFEVENEFFLFTDTAVLAYDENFNSYYPVYIYNTSVPDFFPWTSALVGGVYYFVRKGFGIISYNPITKVWGTVTGTGVPDTPYACLEVDGRLVILGENEYAWSDIDNGTNFITDIQTGTGAQSLNLIGGGIPYGLYRTSDGFCVFTSKGIIKVESIDSIAFSFRHRTLSTDIIPLDQFNVVQFGRDNIIMLTKNGFFTTSGQKPEIFDPLMSEHFVRDIFFKIDLSIVGLIKMYYSNDREFLFVSLADNEVPFLYQRSFVLYFPNQKWGLFNRLHRSIGDFNLTNSPLTERNLGFTCATSYLRIFNQYPVSEVPPDEETLVFFTDAVIYPSRIQDNVLHASSFIHMSGIDRNDYPPNVGLYKQSTKMPQPPDIQSIDSYIIVGPYRLKSDNYTAYLNILDYITVGMTKEPEFVDDEDWNLLSGDEDWNVLDGDEDWGFEIFSGVVYQIEGIGTLDAVNVFDDQQEIMTREEISGRVQIFSCDVHGMYILVKISAQDLNQSFHLKFLEPSVILGGIL